MKVLLRCTVVVKLFRLRLMRKILLQNGYPRGVLCYNINYALNRQKTKYAKPITTVPKKDIFFVLPFLGSQSEVLVRRVKSCVSTFSDFVNFTLFSIILVGLSLSFHTKTV